ncbi:glycosyltransferase family 4 protein [Dictyobacter arantiisoli]|uniref:Glycosyl transferase family 1 n=1 Tax=Dictyobacter arantiisoli TaxID=2014874 RepID=A0A5A5T937_9CHLR|nr:glycosyltransferase family 1 protein [Dictyobacter arantiisoli]GCF07898.1 glycosyl transferase family 1 [Dictyobacter arantiisoli]
MHIGINAQLLSYSQNYRNGGVSRYIRYLLTQLARQPQEHAYTVFVNGQEVIDHLEPHPQITYVSAPWSEDRPTSRIAWEQLTLPTLIRQKQIDVFHSPVNVRPELLPRHCASVVTLHDLAFLRFSHVLTRAKRLYHSTFTVRSLKHATLIITVSDSTKRDLHELVNIPYERIQTIYPCIDERFSNVLKEEKIHSFREKNGVKDGFILYLGTLEPRKNIATLLDAYAQLKQKYQIQEKLVLAGGKGWLYDEIFTRVHQLGLEEAVLFPGFVADSEQALWYQSAAVFAYPSLYEGFGIPVAEALASGTPVVTSNVSSLPEAGAGLALCIDPQDSNALSAALYQALIDQQLRDRCKQLAPGIAQQFSAHAMVEQTIAAYEQAAKIHHQQRITYVQ